MAQAGPHSAQGGTATRRGGMTPAQLYCLLAGAALLLAGLLGFIASTSFETGDGVSTGDELIIFEVNGWHNLVHIASGVLLLSAFRKRTAAKTIALIFGVVYGAVTVIGLIDGTDVLGLIPVNPADNVLHIALSLTGILAALVSPRDEALTTSTAPATTTAAATDAPERTQTAATDRPGDERFDRSLDPRDADAAHHGEQNINR